MNGETAAKNRCVRKSVTRRKSAFAEGGAEFDAIGATFARGEAGLKTLGTEFEGNLPHQITRTTRAFQSLKIVNLINPAASYPTKWPLPIYSKTSNNGNLAFK
jgi:hypothetical protein